MLKEHLPLSSSCRRDQSWGTPARKGWERNQRGSIRPLNGKIVISAYNTSFKLIIIKNISWTFRAILIFGEIIKRRLIISTKNYFKNEYSLTPIIIRLADQGKVDERRGEIEDGHSIASLERECVSITVGQTGKTATENESVASEINLCWNIDN